MNLHGQSNTSGEGGVGALQVSSRRIESVSSRVRDPDAGTGLKRDYIEHITRW